ncbi:MAG: hypothetical protein HN368_12905, partial [Spirochaetales bacterium]|nr:hypothetical protein [Spirochaetales bacterium]
KTASDGKLYYLPVKTNAWLTLGWIYRADFFEKHDISFPETTDDLFNALKTIKKLDPESVPMGSRGPGYPSTMGIGMSAAFRTDNGFFFDPDENALVFGPTTQKWRDMIAFIRKLYDNNLMVQEFPTWTTEQWQGHIVNGKTFIESGYADWSLYFQGLMQDVVPENTWQPSLSWISASSDKPALIGNGSSVYPFGPAFTIALKDENKLDRILQYADWASTVEGAIAHDVGDLGVTYEEVNGKFKFMDHMQEAGLDMNAHHRGNFGLSYWTRRSELSSDMIPRAKDGLDAHAYNLSYSYKKELILWDFNEAENAAKADYETVVGDLVKQAAMQFIMGAKDIASNAEWEAFQTELSKTGLDELNKAYQAAYKRSMQ